MSKWKHVDGIGHGEQVSFETTRNRIITVILDKYEDGAFIKIGAKGNYTETISAYLDPEILDTLIVSLVEAKLKNENKDKKS